MDLLSKTIKKTSLTKDVKELIKVAVSAIMKCVGEWAPHKQHQDLEDRLVTVCIEAIELSYLLRRQWALWEVRFLERPLDLQSSAGDAAKNRQLMFDPSSMKDLRDEDKDRDSSFLKQQYVAMVISPALYKRESIKGKRNGIEHPVVPASVLMRPPPNGHST